MQSSEKGGLSSLLPDYQSNYKVTVIEAKDDSHRTVDGRAQAKVNALWELQSASGEELSALMPSILDKAFKGEL